MTLRKNPTAKARKENDKKRLHDFEEGQKVTATVKKVEHLDRLANTTRADRMCLGGDVWHVPSD